MNRVKYFIYCLLVGIVVSCSSSPDKDRTVSVSILPQRYFVERIAGDFVKVNVMIPPGANPAASDLSPEQLKALYNSSVYFAIGYLPFEVTHLYPVLNELPGIQVVSHSEGIDLLEGSCNHSHGEDIVGEEHQCSGEDCDHDHAHHECDHAAEHVHSGLTAGDHSIKQVDPHIWMSPAYAKRMAASVAEVFSKKFPAEKERFDRNYKRLEAEIDSIDREARRITGVKQEKTIAIYHPALTYFAKDYGMEQVAIESEGKEPNPVHIRETIELCRAKGIRIVFIQSQFDVENAKAVAREIGGEVIAIDPLNPDWKSEMLALLDIIDKKMK